MSLTIRLPWAAIVVSLMLFIAPTTGLARSARLADTIVTNTQGRLLFYTTITNAFTEEMTAAVKNGVPATFSFFVDVYQVRGLWPDKKIVRREVTQTLKYDHLKEKYIISRSWDNSEPLTTESFTTARDWMCRIDSLVICKMEKLEKGRKYEIKAKAQLDKLTLPYYLHYVLFFVSYWDVETDWQTTRFTY